MSVRSLIDSYGKSVTVTRHTRTRDATGGPTISATATTAATMLVQVGGGTTGRKYGSERATFAAVAYAYPDVDVATSDLVTYADGTGTRTYRVESVLTFDERVSTDDLSYQRIDLQEDRPRT